MPLIIAWKNFFGHFCRNTTVKLGIMFHNEQNLVISVSNIKRAVRKKKKKKRKKKKKIRHLRWEFK